MKMYLSDETCNHYEATAAKGSTGAYNSMFECAVTQALRRDHKFTTYVRKTGETDWHGVEIKSGCSETGSASRPLEEIEKAEYILYTPDLPDPETIKTDALACLETCLVFTSAEFIDMLCYIHKGGTEPHIRQTSRGRWNIQTLRCYHKQTGKWSEKPYQKFWEYVRAHNIQNASMEWWEETWPTL